MIATTAGSRAACVQELDDDVEALIGMMDDDVLLPDRGKAIAAEIADALGKARDVRGEDEIGALVGDDQLGGVVEAENALGREHIGRRGVEMLAQKAPQIGRHPRIDREVDDMAAPAPLQRGLEQADEVFGLLLDLDLAVAQHPKDALRDDREAGKQMVEKQRDHLLDRQKADAACPAGG